MDTTKGLSLAFVFRGRYLPNTLAENPTCRVLERESYETLLLHITSLHAYAENPSPIISQFQYSRVPHSVLALSAFKNTFPKNI
jgi:hypothetical protein